MSLPSVGICAVFKNEAPYLREWVLFHLIQGVEAFYLYDNESNDDWAQQIPELADSVIAWPGRGQQLFAYDNCLVNQRPDVDWLAFLDIDEYLWDENGRCLTESLEGVRASRVHVPWRMFGDGAHATAPLGLTIDSYLRCAAQPHPLGKQIVRPGKVTMALTPHEFQASGKPAEVDGLRLHHYWTRSEAECQVKFTRGRACVPERRRWHEYVGTRDTLYEDVDASASLMFGPILRAELAP